MLAHLFEISYRRKGVRSVKLAPVGTYLGESATRMMRLILLRTAASAGEEPPPSEPIGQETAETFVVARSEPLEHLVKKTDNDQKS